MSTFARVLPRLSRTSLVSGARLQLRYQLRCYASYPAHTVIDMPALSPTMSEGNIANWLKKEGDSLSPGDAIAEIETDKAVMEFEFQEEGYLAKILVPGGTNNVQVGKPIGIYVEEADDVAAFKDFKPEDAGEGKAAAKPVEEAAPSKEEPAKKESTTKQQQTTKNQPSSDEIKAPANRIFASPLAKTMALEEGISLKKIEGTGPHGRIVKADIENYLKSASKGTVGAATGAPSVGVASYEDIEITNMRKIIGERLLQSTQNTPSYIVSSDISVSKLLKLRKSLNSSAHERYKLSINDVLVKAITVAAKRVPEANSYWLQDQGIIRKFNNVDISVAVATPTGLLTPIVKNADSKGLMTISKEIKELVARAKINKLAPEEFQGGTICISNMGMNDAVSMFTSIINPPQSSILAVGTVKRVALEDAGSENGISFDDQMTITGTFDHRTIDGAKGAEFMKELKNVIENPLELLL
ncbi:hypothetical protein KAFR_0J00860 [Kazachstania africana CBS 2517]|uniref:Acetyltransferase component of pyruvate dehydrogenase complex n=1 Tax=Kazachstania africana (strain ATCC 22294 / BCRC 22015 / CBS 2517 / CECT 1963 / NBRC 1671 / NRRL Y-8276) TaxID=1071382 RepID=H2B0K4_KAZAF|nr:hypothetical protein KAFR_0J00860 [Kazachstania africana CBS 2517]CCF60154.1 hypothetical protein KAFR_0J00860 [Kazachstania africana CBS 2517]